LDEDEHWGPKSRRDPQNGGKDMHAHSGNGSPAGLSGPNSPCQLMLPESTNVHTDSIYHLLVFSLLLLNSFSLLKIQSVPRERDLREGITDDGLRVLGLPAQAGLENAGQRQEYRCTVQSC
jgi:hypothetical protein